MIKFTTEEVEEFKLEVPTEEEVEAILDSIKDFDVYCGTNSGSLSITGPYCVCARTTGC